MSDTHPFDAAVALAAQPDGSWLGHTSPAYGNMVGPFGGSTAAQAISAVLRHPQRLGDPVAFTFNFAAALSDGEFTIDARPARTNRSTQHWVLDVRQGGDTMATGTAVTALRRETWGVTEHALPDVPGPAEVARARGAAPVEWVKRFDMRFVEGGWDSNWDGQDLGTSRTRLWVRDDPPRALDFASLTSLADTFFPRIWRRRRTFVPIGTVTMTIYFHADAAGLQAVGEGYLLGQAQGQAFARGYFDQTAQLWSEAGDLLATTHQVVYYKE